MAQLRFACGHTKRVDFGKHSARALVNLAFEASVSDCPKCEAAAEREAVVAVTAEEAARPEVLHRDTRPFSLFKCDPE